MDFNQILETYGIPGFALVAAILVIMWASKALFTRSNADTKQEETIRELLSSINEERKLERERNTRLEQSNNHLQAEVFSVREKLAEEIGRRAEIKESIDRERAELKAKQDSNDAVIREMQTSILDLQKNQRDNQAKIRDLETQIEALNTQIANKDGEISALQAKVAQLEAEKAQWLEQNTELTTKTERQAFQIDTLNDMVTQLNKVDVAPAPPVTPVVTSDNTQAIPDMRDVDDTVTPLPVADVPASGNAVDNEASTPNTTLDAA